MLPEKLCKGGEKKDSQTDTAKSQVNSSSLATVQTFEVCEKEDNEDKDEITDPFKCCFRHGWNATTRNETLGAITLWFQDVPMLTICLYFLLWYKTPARRQTPEIPLLFCKMLALVQLQQYWHLHGDYFDLL